MSNQEQKPSFLPHSYEPLENKIIQKKYSDDTVVGYTYTQPNNLLNLVSSTGVTRGAKIGSIKDC